MFERLAARQNSSAQILWASGRHREARRAQMYAGRIRLTLDEPDVTDRMVALADGVYAAPNEVAMYERALDGAVALLRESGFRSVQSTPLIDSSGRVRGVMSTHFLAAGPDRRQHTARSPRCTSAPRAATTAARPVTTGVPTRSVPRVMTRRPPRSGPARKRRASGRSTNASGRGSSWRSTDHRSPARAPVLADGGTDRLAPSR